jgi:hypothetical protein
MDILKLKLIKNVLLHRLIYKYHNEDFDLTDIQK